MKTGGPRGLSPSTHCRARLRPSKLKSSPAPSRRTSTMPPEARPASTRSRHQAAARCAVRSVKPMPPPDPIGLDDGPWLGHRLESAERSHEDRTLLADGEGLAHRMAERVAQVERPRRLHPSREDRKSVV